MDEVLTQDVNAWYAGCWVLAPVGEDMVPSLITDVEDRTLTVSDCTGERHTCDVGDCEVWWPFLGAINIGRVAVFAQRRPRRQWKRSFIARSVTVFCPNAAVVCSASHENNDLVAYITTARNGCNDMRFIRGLWADNYYNLQDAITMVATGQAEGRAINRNTLLTNNHGAIEVWYKSKLAGHISRDANTFNTILPKMATARVKKSLGEVDYA